MSHSFRSLVSLSAFAALAATGQLAFAAGAPVKDEFAQKATWQAPSAPEVRAQLDAWLTSR